MLYKELFRNKYRIKSTRLPHWDYSHPGYYYITICVKDFNYCLGRIKGSKVILSSQGKIVKQCWLDLPKHYNDFWLDEYIIMPNHLHGIIAIGNKGCSPGVEIAHELSLRRNDNVSRSRMQLSKMIGRFKMQSAKKINQLQNTPGKPFWQSRFYDHVIRNDKDLNRIREYIRNNPLKWEYDRNNFFMALTKFHKPLK